MKKLLIILVLLLGSLASYSQEWIKAAESDDTNYYINSTLRTRGTYYVAFEKCVPKNISIERNKMANNFGDTKWRYYSYNVVTLLVDIEEYKSKWMLITYYDTNDNVIMSSDCSDMNWAFAPPNTIAEGVIETVEYILKYK